MTVLSRAEWEPLARAHEQRARRLLADVIERRAHGRRHPIEDFMFDYYRLRPGQLVEWHPGIGVALEDADEVADRRWYTRDDQGRATVDAASFRASRGKTIDWTRELLAAIDTRPAQFSCFGLHEWAMVYGLTPEQTRHAGLPLRFAPEELRAIVNENGLRCSHYDAFRFFTDEAAPMNQTQLTRADQLTHDQSGCLHVNMDLYKYAGKLLPLTPSGLLLDTYELASDIRLLDMRASAYDVSAWGHTPVPVETPEGKADYVRQQREFSARAEVLRVQLLRVLDAVA